VNNGALGRQNAARPPKPGSRGRSLNPRTSRSRNPTKRLIKAATTRSPKKQHRVLDVHDVGLGGQNAVRSPKRPSP
jgi:hypothetical protein